MTIKLTKSEQARFAPYVLQQRAAEREAAEQQRVVADFARTIAERVGVAPGIPVELNLDTWEIHVPEAEPPKAD